MDYEVGDLTNTNSMYQELFGLDEALWYLEESGKGHCLENDLENGLEMAVDSNDIQNSFESSPSFNDDWMTTKIDLDSHIFRTLIAEDVVVDTKYEDVAEVEILTSTSQSGADLLHSTDTSDSILAENPSSPEQNVPNVDSNVNGSIQISDLINAVCSGTVTMDFSDLAYSNQKRSSENLSTNSKNKNALNLENCQDSQELLHSLTSNQCVTKVTTPLPKNTLKVKKKTPEQKKRKQLQNRNAAARYRCKKRSEQEMLNSECDKLEKENQKLRLDIETLQQETQYLKNLIIDIYDKKSA